jgi:quercetin dioxygenase-like cupin family protein
VNLSLGKENPHEETETGPIAEAHLQRSVRRLPGPNWLTLLPHIKWNAPKIVCIWLILPDQSRGSSHQRPKGIGMNASEPERRTFLFGLGSLGISQVFPQGVDPVEAVTPQGYVLGPTGGEHLVHFRDHGNIYIKVGSATGSDAVALGSQQVTLGAGIPIHRHLGMDEAFYVLAGSGILTLNDAPHAFEKGGIIFIPRNSWHGFSNPDHELLLLWIMSPAGLDGFFRETCNPPGVPPKQFTREQIREIALKYGTEFR